MHGSKRFIAAVAVTLSAAVAILVMTVAASPTTAQLTGETTLDKVEHPGARARFRGHRARRGGELAFRGLNLTDEQKAQLKEIRESHSAAIRPLAEQLRAKKREIRQAMGGETFDEGLVTQKLTESANIEARLMAERFKLRQAMLSVLTLEQKAALDQKREQFKSKLGGRRARRSQS